LKASGASLYIHSDQESIGILQQQHIYSIALLVVILYLDIMFFIFYFSKLKKPF